jgi:hypothetical protein
VAFDQYKEPYFAKTAVEIAHWNPFWVSISVQLNLGDSYHILAFSTAEW